MDTDLELRSRCSRFLSHHRPVRPEASLAAFAAHPAAAAPADVYGEGGAVGILERRVEKLIGKPRGRFFIKGVAAQLSVLSVYAERRCARSVVAHPMSHLNYDERGAVERTGGLDVIRVGLAAPFGVEDLQAISERLAAVVVELPLRRSGFLLPSLEELIAVAEWCRSSGTPLHFDGARIWEAAAAYGVTLERLASLADSIYVSFYKGLGGIGGAMVLASEDFISDIGPWKTRFSGDLYTAYPQAISALIGLDAQLPEMRGYLDDARSLASRLAELDGVIVQPAVPHTNSFQLWLCGTKAALIERHRRLARDHGVWLFNSFIPAPLDGHCVVEVVIGDASRDWSVDEAAAWVASVVGS